MSRKRSRGCLQNIFFLVNSILALVTLLAYILPYIPPKTFPLIAVLSLGMPVLLIFNFLFLIYWLVFLRREFLLSLCVLLLGFNHVLSLYRINSHSRDTIRSIDDIKVMSYNVRAFNRFKWIDEDSIPEKAERFIQKEAPDIICFQEFFRFEKRRMKFDGYQYQFFNERQGRPPQAIYSKYPIIKTGDLDFPSTGNNAIYADIVIKNDTIRVFDFHLQSLKIDTDVEQFGDKEKGKKLYKNIGYGFKKQQSQLEILLKAVNTSPYKKIICGDMNNSPYSYVYRKLSENYKDAFKEAGTGFGSTFIFDIIPLRLDVILIDKDFAVEEFKNYRVKYSDHYPIMTRINIK